jgi:hypothetical protein
MGRLLAERTKSPNPQSARSRDESTNHNQTGLPGKLKAGIEQLSGLAMDDVRVHYNSSKPAEFQALAHTHGNEIHLGPRQEKHLPHEAWHVAQQKQGRVKPTSVLAKDASINEDAGLEREADEMGARASRESLSSPVSKNKRSPSQSLQQQVVQPKRVPFGFGVFESDLTPIGGRGVNMVLLFHPDETKVDAKKIALIQSVRSRLPSGAENSFEPGQADKTVPGGQPGAGYHIDRLSNFNNPIFGADSLGDKQQLKDTPQAKNTTTNPTKVGTNTKYELGHCFKENPKDTKKKQHPAGLWDTPLSPEEKGRNTTFETAALAIDGNDENKYYGSVSWGYKIEAGGLTTSDIELVAKGPSANFIEPAKLWNVRRSQGRLMVTPYPEATVKRKNKPDPQKLPGNKILKQLSTLQWPGGTEPAIEAAVLDDDGAVTEIVYIKIADVQDLGDGLPNKPLPIPGVKPADKK